MDRKRNRDQYPVTSYRSVLCEAYEFYERQALNEIESIKMTRHEDRIGKSSMRKLEFKGDKRLGDIRKYLDSFTGYERSDMQRRFHEAFLQAVCLHIYKDDADVDYDNIMRQNDWPNLRQQCLCMTPR